MEAFMENRFVLTEDSEKMLQKQAEEFLEFLS